MSSEREAILGRIAEALRDPAPRHHEHVGSNGRSSATAPFQQWLPPVGASHAARLQLFAQLCGVLRTEFKHCASAEVAAKHIDALAKDGHWRRIALHSGELIDSVAAHLSPSLEVMRIESGYDRDALEACDAGLTECESLVAQTGSVCVTSRSSGGRTLSVLPPHHIVIAREDQLVGDLTEAYEKLAARYGANYPSFIGFISGPSRTGDIERILVLGAHGPKKLSILVIQ